MEKTDEAKQRERRRLRGARLLERGVAQAAVARRLKVSRATVHAWKQRLEAGGIEALRQRRRGRPPRLGDAQRTELTSALKRGARAAGYATELWTLPRIARLIESHFGIRLIQGRTIVFVDESGLSERPTRVRTWAPRGKTPVLHTASTGSSCP